MTEWRNALTTNTYDIAMFGPRAQVLHFNVMSTFIIFVKKCWDMERLEHKLDTAW
jgi:hypothetical protein